ncbi:AAA family ATPase [Brumimicrobium oceani]|nr:AAA family ATPase [Brumimicrobium oceani]
MELLYIWIDKFRNIDDKGYNFSNQYDVSYNKTNNELIVNDIQGESAVSVTENRLELNSTTNYLAGFFPGNISNITAIIGKNSTGKSNVLDFLLTALHTGNRIKLTSDYFLLFKDDGELKFSGRIGRESIRNSEINCLEIKVGKTEPNSNWHTVFYSNVADNRNYIFEDKITFNYSFSEIQRSQSNKLEYVSSNDFEQTWNRITNNTENSQMIRFKLEPVVFNKVRNNNKDSIINGVYQRYYKAIFQESKSNSNRYKYTLTIALFSYLVENEHISKGGLTDIRLLNNGFAEEIAVLQPKIREVLSNIEIEDFNSNEVCFTSLEQFKLFLDFIDAFDTTNYRLGEFKKDNQFIEVDFDNDFKSLIQPFISLFNLTDIIHHDWSGLSSGMKAYLNLYSQLFNTKETINQTISKSLLICIDEGDLYMHPEWQRSFLNDLIKFINTNFDNKHIQILLTSHSPFLISDLPKENVLLLDKNGIVNRQLGEESSFGANIHQLFANQFFLANKGTTGAFAKEKIIELSNRISSIKTSELSEIEHLIEMIGEPILRYRLQDKLKEYISENFADEDKINWHKRQIEKLESNDKTN